VGEVEGRRENDVGDGDCGGGNVMRQTALHLKSFRAL